MVRVGLIRTRGKNRAMHAQASALNTQKMADAQ
jgi:hypothetical protein